VAVTGGLLLASAPRSLTEWSPYADLRPPHVDGGLVSKRGEFRLVALDGGRRTRLTGSTTYALAVAPEAYWRIYAEWLLHRIHERVLRHIAARAEAASEPGPPASGTDGAP